LKDRQVNINIKINSIYRDSIAEITFSSFYNFKVQIFSSVDILEINNGSKTKNYLIPEKDDKMYKLSLMVRGLIEEKILFVSSKFRVYYGTQLYPFISSKLRLKFKLYDSFINTIYVDIPNNYRIIWNKAFAKCNNNDFIMKYSEEKERIVYYFICNKFKSLKNERENLNCEINAILRLSGIELAKIIDFPIYYYILVLFLTALAALSTKINALLAIIGGAWLFILRYWSKINIPRFQTVGTYIYIVAGITIFIWGIFWKLFNYAAFLLLFIYIPLILYLMFEIRKFKLNGSFSKKTEKLIGKIIKKNKDIKKKYNVKKVKMETCLCFLGGIILLGIGYKYICIDKKEKEKLENKHKNLEKFKLEREINDLDVEINLQKILIKKKVKEFFGKDIDDIEIKEVYEILKDNIKPCEIDEALKNIENLKCMDLYKNDLEDIKEILDFIKENQKVENVLKEIEKLEKMKNEKKALENKKNLLEIFNHRK